MIASLKPYPSYKDSGAPWLGRMPEGWGVKKVRHIAKLFTSNVDKKKVPGEVEVRLCNYTNVYKNELITNDLPFMKASAAEEEVRKFKVKKGDVPLTKDSEIWTDIGVPAYVDYEAPDLVYGYHLAILRPRSEAVDGKYLFRALQSQPVAVQLHVEATGVTRFGLSQEAIKSTILPHPLLPEQRAIVKFLDWAERRIRFIVAARKRRIQLLEEYRQALINDAVTGKFDVRTGKPYPSYKGSGVPWLGKVPVQWEIVRLKRIARLAYGDSLPANERQKGEVPVYGSNGPVGSHNSANTAVPVIIIGRKGSFGKIQYSDKRVFAIDTTFFIDKRYTDADLRWLFYMLSQLELDRPSQDSAVPGLDREEAYQKLTVLPPLPEQRAIAEYLDREIAKIDAAIEKTKESTALWEELRETLISDVVTGKLDVREAAERLPEEEPELEERVKALEGLLLGGESEVSRADSEPELASAEETA